MTKELLEKLCKPPRYFWYSREAEIYMYESLARAMEWGTVSTLDIPWLNECRITVAGEPVEIRYNFCSSERNVYEKGSGECEVGWTDLVYLGEGEISRNDSFRDIPTIVARMKELGCSIIPSVLTRTL